MFVEDVRRAATPIVGPEDLEPLFDRMGEASLVLLGEASHGTHEFYETRAEITKRLIEEQGFAAMAVEADWPDAFRVDRYVRGEGDDPGPDQALSDFRRFPAWMWRNRVVLDFVAWLRQRNDAARSSGQTVAGFYGLDLYSLHASRHAVVRYLDGIDAEAGRRARERYACFDHYGTEGQAYGRATAFGEPDTCEDEVVEQLLELRGRAGEYLSADGRRAAEAFLSAEQNARVVRGAERYYRAMYSGGPESWNLRDEHMADTLEALREHLRSQGEVPRIVVWAHNSHLGDARATRMAARGELNVGQLVRERHGDDAVLVGFTTFTGAVTAASDWGMPAERKRVREALPRSYERAFHETGVPRFLLLTDAVAPMPELLERAIGVIYRPQTERASHYFVARLDRQFDAVIHLDDTRALEPLERPSGWEAGEPETYPWAV
ncbi:MAG: erythromycin esterase family protein [Actinomycetota bacterium]|nr:erythromycin esterase family protein [Actinomycetota bacterium]